MGSGSSPLSPPLSAPWLLTEQLRHPQTTQAPGGLQGLRSQLVLSPLELNPAEKLLHWWREQTPKRHPNGLQILGLAKIWLVPSCCPPAPQMPSPSFHHLHLTSPSHSHQQQKGCTLEQAAKRGAGVCLWSHSKPTWMLSSGICSR